MKFTIFSISALSLFTASLSAQVMPGDIAFTLYDARDLRLLLSTRLLRVKRLPFVMLRLIL